MPEEHVDVKGTVKEAIEELENTAQLMRTDEIIKECKLRGIAENEVSIAIDELIEDNYIHVVEGTDGLIARTIWQDYSPALEDHPEW